MVLETTGEAERLLSQSNHKNDLKVINRFLSLVTQDLEGETLDPKFFENMLSGDRTKILLEVRCLSHESLVEFQFRCPQCGAESEQEFDLEDCLKAIKPYPSMDQLEFEVEVGPGVLHFELPTGETEIKIAKEKDIEINTKLRCMKIWEEVEGQKVPVNIDKLKSSWIAQLRQEIKAKECQIDTQVDVQCPHCGQNSRFDIMGNPDFLFPHAL